MKKRILVAVFIVAVLTLAAFVPVLQTQNFSHVITRKLTVTGSGGATVQNGGLTVTAGGATVTAGGVTLSDGDLVVADDLRITAQTLITATDAATFTVTGTYQPIDAASEITPTIAAGAAGDMVVLINVGSNTINLADGGILVLTAAAALGQNDTLTLWSDGTNWIEISRADN